VNLRTCFRHWCIFVLFHLATHLILHSVGLGFLPAIAISVVVHLWMNRSSVVAFFKESPKQ
jgi:hypothetical protein